MLFTFKCDEVNYTHEYRDTPDISVNQWPRVRFHGSCRWKDTS